MIDFAPSRPATTARITCRACGIGVVVTLPNRTLLCGECRADLTVTRQRVLAWLRGVVAMEQAALAAFDAVRLAHPKCWSRLDGRPAGSDARARAASPTYALLLDAELVYQQTLTPLIAERARLEAALQEIDTL